MKPIIIAQQLNINYKGKDILEVPFLQVYEGQRIGIIGSNGSGKTSLLKALANEDGLYDVTHTQTIHWVHQSLDHVSNNLDTTVGKRMGVVEDRNHESGGERMRRKIAEAISSNAHILFVDEPTNNMDEEGMEETLNILKYYPGTILLVSHDRAFMNAIVDTVWEIREKSITIYEGNYDAYAFQKQHENQTHVRAYEHYQHEKKALHSTQQQLKQSAQKMQGRKQKKSENSGRLSHAKGSDSKQKAINRKIKDLEKKMDNLESIEKPQTEKFPMFRNKTSRLYSKFPIIGRDVSKRYEDKVLFTKLNFDIPLDQKVGIVGKNGSGKTSLIQMILNREKGIQVSEGVKFGYFSQKSLEENAHLSAYDYFTKHTNLDVQGMRSVIANLRLPQHILNTTITHMSPGEATRLMIAAQFLSENNVIILDEPSNNLDVAAIHAIEALLQSYEGTLILVSHDRKLREAVCTMTISL